jgi:fructan beta-fructosidase
MQKLATIAALFMAWTFLAPGADSNSTNARSELLVNKAYLHLPVKNGAPKHWVSLRVDGQVARDFEIELAETAPDWWAFIELAPWQGKRLTVEADKMPVPTAGFQSICQADAVPDAATLYQEALRPQLHFSSRRGWNNDPNGLVRYRGEYHLFYQHNPYGWNWGNMHWGHAVSRDLVHWRELDEALIPDRQGTMFSGSAVVDARNTSGLGSRAHPAMVCLYTAAGDTSRESAKVPFTQCLAYSLDGRGFQKFAGNPVVNAITPGNRDPKVFWHEPTQKWVMALYVETNKIHTIQFFGSADLKQWSFLSQSDGFFECPDFFELPVDGKARKWVLTAASSEYQVGTFDGRRFLGETGKLPGHRGQGFYAAQTYSDMADGRRIQIGWLQAPSPGMPFNQCMTLPLELSLKNTSEGPRLAWQPVKELRKLRAKNWRFGALTLQPGAPNPAAKAKAELMELRAEFQPGESCVVSFGVRGATIEYDGAKRELSVNGHRVPAPLREGKQRLIVYADRTALEVFASDGLVYVPFPFIPSAENRSLEVAVKSGEVKFSRLDVSELKSVWSH